MLTRTDPTGRPLYRVTSGGNVVRTRPITQRLKKKVVERDGNTCVECGASETVMHAAHIEPYRISGNNSLENLRLLCPRCHAEEDRA
ncbi:MAG: HNH endonuclease [Mycobacteriaceae bacterium]|jgi:5-methylcytosine-specific restriction endonuclease McrA